jgi:CDP-diacylglycerol--glycerol-3-phosphate 3-phosphatidyltransferase
MAHRVHQRSEQGGRGSAPLRFVTVANGFTFVRLMLVPACGLAITTRFHWIAFACFWLAVATDLVDGPVARRRGEVSAFGGFFDHVTDAVFVASGLAAIAYHEMITPLLAPLIVLAFTQYALDSRVLAGRRLRSSRIGRWNGVAYYVLLGTALTRNALGLDWPGHGLVSLFGWVLVVTTLFSMIDRAGALVLSAQATESGEDP